MTTFYLIRHAANPYLVERKIAGWLPGIHLNAEGQKQAQHLAERLAREPIRAIYTSPLERAYETAEPIAAKLGLSLQVSEGLGEIRFGDWTDQTIAKLDTIPQWQRWNSFRSGTQMPNGEAMIEAQARIVREMLRLRDVHPNERIALVTHGDPIKAAIAYFIGAPLDLFLRIEVDPASVSIIGLDNSTARIIRLNA